MSKRNEVLAKNLLPGDTIKLVYEIEVTKMDDLDTIIAAESDNMFFIKGTVINGPVRKHEGTFAVHGDAKMTLVSRRNYSRRVLLLLKSLFASSNKADEVKVPT